MPKLFKPRPLPFAIKDKISCELDCREQAGIIEKVSHSDWASPIVTVPKNDRSYRICVDYKVTVNLALDIDQYPLQPCLEEKDRSLVRPQTFDCHSGPQERSSNTCCCSPTVMGCTTLSVFL